MPSKVFITGATGLLGRAIFQSFKTADWEVIGTGLSRANGQDIVKLDLLDHDAVEAAINKANPSLIIHSAADRSPDSVAADPARARALNVDSTSYLTSIASSRNIPVLYISTDYVFPGVPGEAPYAETAAPRATNLYGQLKLEGEHAVLATPASKDPGTIPLGAVLRVPVLYGHVDASIGNSESAVNVLVDKVRDCAGGKKVVMDDWAKRTPTNVADVGDCIVKIGEKWVEALKSGEEFPTIMQFSAGEVFTKYEMCEIFAGILGVDIGNMERDGAGGGGGGGGVQRPYDTRLGTGVLEKLMGGKLSTVGFKQWWSEELKG